MTDHTALLESVRAADPWPAERSIPAAMLAVQSAAILDGMDAQQEPRAPRPGPIGIRRGLAVALGSAAVVAVLLVGASLLFGGSDAPVDAPTQPTTSSIVTTTTPTTVLRPSFDVEALASVQEPRTQ